MFPLSSRGAGKKGKIHIHNSNEIHNSLKRYLICKDRKNNFDYTLDKNLQQQEQRKMEEERSNELMIKILSDYARYVADQNLAFRGHIDEERNLHQLVNLLSRHNPILEDWLKNNNNNNQPYELNI